MKKKILFLAACIVLPSTVAFADDDCCFHNWLWFRRPSITIKSNPSQTQINIRRDDGYYHCRKYKKHRKHRGWRHHRHYFDDDFDCDYDD